MTLLLPPEGIRFLDDLAVNNRRDWFEAHRDAFRCHVQDPLHDLVAELAPTMAAIDPMIETAPRRGVISRIHRDTRFSHDKTPYRTRMWIGFKRPGKDWPARPAYFVEVSADGARHGMGFYAAPPATMRALRAAAEARPETFAAALDSATAAGFAVLGPEYARPRVPARTPSQDLPPAVQDLFRRKSLHVEASDGPIAGGFTALGPLYHRLLTVSA